MFHLLRLYFLLSELEVRGAITSSESQAFRLIDITTKQGRISDRDSLSLRILQHAQVKDFMFRKGWCSLDEKAAMDRLDRDTNYRTNMLWEYYDKILPTARQYPLCRRIGAYIAGSHFDSQRYSAYNKI